MKQNQEEEIQKQIADYLSLQYPNIPFHSDVGSGIRLPMGLAIRQKRLNAGRRGWPDLFIAAGRSCESCGVDVGEFGLFLELKKDGETLYPGPRAKRRFKSIDGKEYKTEHLMEQADVLFSLRKAGYVAKFAIGFKEATRIIDEYLGDKECSS